MAVSLRLGDEVEIHESEDGHGLDIYLGATVGNATVNLTKGTDLSGPDYVLKFDKPLLDGADAERPDREWCWIHQQWYPKGTHPGPK